MIAGELVGRALVAAFVLASLVPVGATLLLAIARLVGADWSAIAPFSRPLPWLVPLGAVALLLGTTPPPPHLAVWQHPVFVAVRAGLALGALAWAAARLRRGASVTFAGVMLALYAALVTPVGADWLLAGAPGHGVSAIGMILFVEQIGAACALLLVTGIGGERLRSDMAKLLVAAMLGLGYLAFMDYLIVWFGNLPEHVRFYQPRAVFPAASLVPMALLIGLGGTIGLLAGTPGERGQRGAGVCAMVGIALFDLWWMGGGIRAVIGLVTAAAVLALMARRATGKPTHA